MTAVADFTTICTILKGSAPTQQQLGKVSDLFAEVTTGSNEQRAASAIAGMRARIRAMLREKAEQEVYAGVLKRAHFPADQPALLASVSGTAKTAGDEAEGAL